MLKEGYRATDLAFNNLQPYIPEVPVGTDRHVPLHVPIRPERFNRSVDELQTIWNRTLGAEETKKTGEMKNYNPVLARWNFERARTDKEKELFREYELMNITTSLRERHHTHESRLQLTIDSNRKVRNEAFPDEPYEEMLERGLAYREKQGSQDLERERAEIVGFEKIQNAAPDAPLGSTFMVVSPPSSVKDSPYVHNFVDGYQIAEDPATGERVLNYVRFSSPLGMGAYTAIAQRLDPDFHENKAKRMQDSGKTIPDDAWYLENPFFIPAQDGKGIDEVFTEYFAPDVIAMEEAEWQKIDRIYAPYKLYLLDQLTKDDFDPVAIAKAYNILLLSQEREHLQIPDGEHVVFEAGSHKLTHDMYRQLSVFAQNHGHETAKKTTAGCGSSGSISVMGSGENNNPLLNSVSQFGKPKEKEWFSCPECPYKASGPVGNSCPGCGLTKERYAEKSGISCD